MAGQIALLDITHQLRGFFSGTVTRLAMNIATATATSRAITATVINTVTASL